MTRLDGIETVLTAASALLGGRPASVVRLDGGPVSDTIDVAAQAGIDRAAAEVGRTGRAARPVGGSGRAEAVAVPITVAGRLWGALAVAAGADRLPDDAEDLLALAAVAIGAALDRAALAASRVRVVAAADATRRRLQRDLHAGTQQRLAHTVIALKLARDALPAGSPATDLVGEALTHAERASRELRDLVQSVLPASLVRGGLQPGLESLVADLALPVDLQVTPERLAPATETTAYLVVAEALAGVVEHARARHVCLCVDVVGDTLVVEVSDDGVGGADPLRGTGLRDRIDAAEGRLTLTSPPGGGTVVRAELPVGHPSAISSRNPPLSS